MTLNRLLQVDNYNYTILTEYFFIRLAHKSVTSDRQITPYIGECRFAKSNSAGFSPMVIQCFYPPKFILISINTSAVSLYQIIDSLIIIR